MKEHISSMCSSQSKLSWISTNSSHCNLLSPCPNSSWMHHQLKAQAHQNYNSFPTLLLSLFIIQFPLLSAGFCHLVSRHFISGYETFWVWLMSSETILHSVHHLSPCIYTSEINVHGPDVLSLSTLQSYECGRKS